MFKRFHSILKKRPWQTCIVKALRKDSSYSLSEHCWRTHTCGELTTTHVGESVTLCGWVQFVRQDKFIILRDWNGSVQLLIENLEIPIIPRESVIKVSGVIQKRPQENINPDLKTGSIEVSVSNIDLLNLCTDLPMPVHTFLKKNEDTRMQFRYLDIRTETMQKNLRVRSKVMSKMREFLVNFHEFVEVETPTLFRPTPGGAKEFIVPSSLGPGLFYSLPQSPQQFKQLLMVGGLDRYFQVARCYRDETTRPDRQPEFTQLDLELSFVSSNDVMELAEDLIKHCWPEDLGNKKFPRMKFDDVFDLYGTDKPDLRYEFKLKDVTKYFEKSGLLRNNQIANAIILQPEEASFIPDTKWKKIRQKFHKNLIQLNRQDLIMRFQNGSFKIVDGVDVTEALPENIKDLNLEEGCLLWVGWGVKMEVKPRMGKLRTFIADTLLNLGADIKCRESYKFLWIYDFPLFETGEDGLLKTVHHPFTSPHPDDLDILESDPTKVRSLAYDLVLNGNEVAGGSIRIHDPILQKRILEDYLDICSSDLGHMLQALASGAPPHGGIAFGIDRLLSELLGTNSIRDVIAFPKTSTSRDLMANSPCTVEEETLNHYHLKINHDNTAL